MDKVYSNDIRNIALVSHIGTGKTSLADAIAFNGGLNSRIGRVDEGNSFFDFEAEEIKRKTTLSQSFATFMWGNKKLNLVDTPGSSEFMSETKSALKAVDSAFVVIDSVEGLKFQSKKIIEDLERQKIPYSIFINKLDRENSNFKQVFLDLKKHMNRAVLLLQLPMGEDINLTGIVDILGLKAFSYPKDSLEYNEIKIPDELAKEVKVLQEKSIETILECEDELLEKYLNGDEISQYELVCALKKGIIGGKIVPVLTGSAHKNIGVKQLLNFIADFMPSPLERDNIYAINKNNEPELIKLSKDEDIMALVIKTLSDPYSGKYSIVRLFAGSLHSDEIIYNSSQEDKEKISQIIMLQGKKHELIPRAIAGDIVALPKLKHTHTGDSLSTEKNPLILSYIKLPEPVLSYAIKSKQKNDEDKIYSGFKKLKEEDPSIDIHRDEETKQIILSGMGQVHLDVTTSKLFRRYGVEVILEAPQIPYKETITSTIKVQGKYKKQSGGKGQYGDCWIELSPIERGKGFEFIDNIVGGAIPRQYIPAVEAGIREAMQEGILSNYQAVDIKAVLYDGSYHNVDSSEMAFKIAGSLGFKKGAVEANPIMLEPVMSVEITVPESYVGDVIGDLSSRRGKMLGIEAEDHTQIIKSLIPMSEIINYSSVLNSMTGGAGSFTAEFYSYEEAPNHIALSILMTHKKVA
ncbi:MAG: elongation factor G [bacterium]